MILITILISLVFITRLSGTQIQDAHRDLNSLFREHIAQRLGGTTSQLLVQIEDRFSDTSLSLMDNAAKQEMDHPIGAEARAHLVQKQLQSAWITAVMDHPIGAEARAHLVQKQLQSARITQPHSSLVRRGILQFPAIVDAVKTLKESPEIISTAKKVLLELEFVESLKSVPTRQFIEEQIAEITAMKHFIDELVTEFDTLAETEAKNKLKDPNSAKRMREIYTTIPTAEAAFLNSVKTRESQWISAKKNIQSALGSKNKYTSNYEDVKEFLSNEIKEMDVALKWFRQLKHIGPETLQDLRKHMEETAIKSGIDLHKTDPKPVKIQELSPESSTEDVQHIGKARWLSSRVLIASGITILALASVIAILVFAFG